MGDLISYPKRGAHAEGTGLVGMIIFLGSWAMIFACLFFAYGYLRSRSAVWPPLDLPRPPTVLGGLNTLVLLGSSLALQLGLVAVRRGHLRATSRLIAVAAVLGLAFLQLQIFSWHTLTEQGLVTSAGSYASIFFALTWFHAAHVLVGVVALALLAVRAFRGSYSVPRHQPVRLWTIYWHFVGVVWILMYVTVYLV